jgi:hypothetical protein
MRPLWGAAALALFLAITPVNAADLSKIERTVGREPAYGAKPQYCLLVFGTEAATRVWLVLDGETLHVSNNIGELTGDGSREVSMTNGNWFNVGYVTELDGKTKVNVRVRRFDGAYQVTANYGDRKRFQGAGFDDDNKLHFADRADQAPIIHFGGPMEIGLSGGTPKLQVGKETMIHLGIGTPGVGRGSFAAYQGCAAPAGTIAAALDVPKTGAPGGKVSLSAAIENKH